MFGLRCIVVDWSRPERAFIGRNTSGGLFVTPRPSKLRLLPRNAMADSHTKYYSERVRGYNVLLEGGNFPPQVDTWGFDLGL